MLIKERRNNARAIMLIVITINVDPVAFSIGPIHPGWYAIMYGVGITAGLLVSRPYAKSKGITFVQLAIIAFWSIIAGLLGARLYYVLQQPLSQYIHHPDQIFAYGKGGLAFYGAIFAVVPTIAILARRMRLSIWQLLDIGSIFAVVGQFFGRIGNIINGDVIGYPTNLPWGFIYANPRSFAPDNFTAYQPAAVYEALLDLILFVFLWRLRNRFKAGWLFFLYIIGYSAGQLIIFVWRDNKVIALGLKQAQLTAIGVIIVAAVIFLWLLKRQRATMAQTQKTSEQNNQS